GAIPLVYRLFAAILLAIFIIASLKPVKTGPLLHKIADCKLSTIIDEYFQQFRRNQFDLCLVFNQPFHTQFEIAINELQKPFSPTFVKVVDESKVLNLFVRKLAVRSINLCKNIARIDEEDAVVSLALVEKPERRRKCNRVKHVGGQRQHGVDKI